jgi:hypothetical protein
MISAGAAVVRSPGVTLAWYSRPIPMGDRSAAFIKGGFGCLLAFFAFGLVAVVAGGRVHIDCGGAGILFLIGGVIGLIFLGVFKKGVRAGQEQADPASHEAPLARRATWWCKACGCTNPVEAKICQRCHSER